MIEVQFTGTDGSVWDLRRGPVRITDGGLKGLGDPDVAYFTRESPYLDGQELTGWRVKPRKLFVPLLLGVDTVTELEWLALDRAWTAANGIGEQGTLKVTAPDGTVRSIKIRHVATGDLIYTADPAVDAWLVVGYNYEADDPWWRGPAIPRIYGGGGSSNFYGPGGLGPPFYISSANTIASATIDNPGDAPMWPIYELTGAISAWSSTMAGGTVSDATLIAAGSVLTVDTRPTRKIALLNVAGTITRVTKRLTSKAYRPIPKGSAVALDLVINGPGQMKITAEPVYRKAM